MSVYCENQQLIRMENSKGIGPFKDFEVLYNKGLSCEEESHASWFKNSSHSRMPGARSEFGELFTINHRCAYLSLQSFSSYWNDERALLTYLKCGFVIFRIQTLKCHTSFNQAIYLPEHVLSKQAVNLIEIKRCFYKSKVA